DAVVNGFVQVGDRTMFIYAPGSSRAADDIRLLQSPELWSTDGTVGGTRRVKTLSDVSFIGINDSNGAFNESIVAGKTLYFTATDTAHGKEFWKTDGTADGTHLVKDVFHGTVSSNPTSITAGANGAIYFFAETNAGTYGAW